MAHCVLSFRGHDEEFNEDRLIDGMSVVWISSKEESAFWEEVRQKWQSHVKDLGGVGILDFPFDEWFATEDRAQEFLSLLDASVSILELFGKEIPTNVMKEAISEPDRVRKDVPVAPYVEALRRLRMLIAKPIQQNPPA